MRDGNGRCVQVPRCMYIGEGVGVCIMCLIVWLVFKKTTSHTTILSFGYIEAGIPADKKLTNLSTNQWHLYHLG